MPKLRTLLGDEDDEIRVQCVDALSAIAVRESTVRSQVQSALAQVKQHDQSEHVRRRAAEALTELSRWTRVLNGPENGS